MTNEEKGEPDGVSPSLARHGKVSYLEIPALDLEQSARFYESLFGWKLERHDAGISFDDGTGELIGRWVAGRLVSSEPGFLPYIYVEDVDAAFAKALGQGGALVEAPYPEGNLRIATILDPAGNLIGIWQEQAR
jgi:uncharacterized protein